MSKLSESCFKRNFLNSDVALSVSFVDTVRLLLFQCFTFYSHIIVEVEEMLKIFKDLFS